MGAYDRSELLEIELPEDVDESMPYVFDDHSLAFSLGIRCKTLWWLLLTNNCHAQDSGKGLYKKYEIPKRGKNSGYRTIHEPCPVLKNVQKSILVTFFGDFSAPDHIGAYVSGRDQSFTAEQHVGQEVKISLDIKDFFPYTRRAWIRNWLRTFGYNNWVVEALSNLMVIPRHIKPGFVLSTLPQGAPTSSLVSNFVANRRIDTPVMEYLDNNDEDYVYTRYADDIEISFSKDLSFERVDNLIEKITGVIHENGYKVNRKKTKIQRQKSPDIPMRVLGMTVNEKVNIPREEYRRLRAIVHNCKTKGFDTQYERADKDSPFALYEHVKGKLIYWNQINEELAQPLLDDLEEAAQSQDLKE